MPSIKPQDRRAPFLELGESFTLKVEAMFFQPSLCVKPRRQACGQAGCPPSLAGLLDARRNTLRIGF